MKSKRGRREALRELAEAKLGNKPQLQTEVESEGDLRRGLVHELQVHQIELELQNEELQQTKEALEASLKEYSELYDFAPVGYFTLDLSGEIVAANLRGATLLGVERSQLLGRNFKTFVSVADRTAFSDFLDSLYRSTTPQNSEVLLELGQGREIAAKLEAVLAEGTGKCRMAVSDISRIKEAEKARLQMEERMHQSHKMQAIGTLAAGIAHDFNNILSAILGFTELTLPALPPDSDEHENLREVIVASLRARDLVRQILLFGRKGEQDFHPIEVDLVVREAIKLLRSLIPTTVDIKLEIESQSFSAQIDAAELHQVVMNLCTNAYQSMPGEKGLLRVRLSLAKLDSSEATTAQGLKPGDYVRLDVIDNGSGMDQATAARIFEPYFTTKDVGKGTGLGLAIVHGIVTSIGGAILVHSTPGTGTSFVVYLPSAKPYHEAAAEQKDISSLQGNGSILVVDDELSLGRLAGKMLESLGYKVTIVNDPIEAIRLFESDPQGFDAIVTDQTMPGMTGAELVSRAKAARPGVAAVMCTGYSDLIDEEGAKQIGVAAYVRKPFTRNVLGEAVAKALGRNG